MNVYNLSKNEVFNIDKGNSTKNIDFNVDSKAEKDGIQWSQRSDPRITKYSDTYSITPYATYMITPLSQMDGEDIVSRFDRCYGEWENIGRCHKDKPCKRVEQEFYIHNLDYTGEHCRDSEGRRLRDGDTRHVFCNHNMNRSERCNGHGKCSRNNSSNTCICDTGYSGPNCEIHDPCLNVNCLHGGTCNNGVCECKDGWYGSDCSNGDKYRCNTKDDCSDNSTCMQTISPGVSCCKNPNDQNLNEPPALCNPNATPPETCPDGTTCPKCNNPNLCCCPSVPK